MMELSFLVSFQLIDKDVARPPLVHNLIFPLNHFFVINQQQLLTVIGTHWNLGVGRQKEWSYLLFFFIDRSRVEKISSTIESINTPSHYKFIFL